MTMGDNGNGPLAPLVPLAYPLLLRPVVSQVRNITILVDADLID